MVYFALSNTLHGWACTKCVPFQTCIWHYTDTKEIPDLVYRPVQWCCQPWCLNWGSSCFLPTTHATTNAKQLCPRSSHIMWHFTRVYLHAKTAVDAGDIHTWQTTVILITGKTQRPPPPIPAPCRDKNGTGLWDLPHISVVWHNTKNHTCRAYFTNLFDRHTSR